jgi:ferritin-like metal-binding protein YciE
VDHFIRTRERILRLEEVFKLIGQPPRGAASPAAEAIVAETKATLDMIDDTAARSAARFAAMQALKHVLAARYLTLTTWSEVLRRPDLGGLLKAFVVEEGSVTLQSPELMVVSGIRERAPNKSASMGDRLTDLFDSKK